MLKRFSAIIVSVVLSLNIFAQGDTEPDIPPFDYSDPSSYEIANITVSGANHLNESTIIQLSGLDVGQNIQIPGDRISEAIDKLWKQELFSDVSIYATKIENNEIWLNIQLQGNPRISEVILKGVKGTNEDKVTEKAPAKAGLQLTENLLNNTRNILREFYYGKGFYNVGIEFIEKPDTSMVNASKLIIKVNKDDRVKIKDINITGNTLFSDWKIRRLMDDTKQKVFFRFWKASRYQPDKFESDKQKIIEAYKKEGFRDVKIVSDSVYFVENDRLQLDMEIAEGERYYFGNIDWVGNTQYSDQQLAKALKIKKGNIYNEILLNKRLNKAQDAVGNLYLDNGYLFYQCNPVEVDLKNDTVDLEMRIYEGEQAHVDEVSIVGNTKTNEHVIRRELYTKPGQLFNKSRIVRSVRELSQLGFFNPEKIQPTPSPEPSTGTVDLEYSVEERSNDQIKISGGWGAGMIIGSIGLTLNNLSVRNIFNKDAWKPLPTGDGESLSINARSNGRRYQSYNISFTEPWVGGKRPNSLSVSGFHSLRTNGLKTSNPDRESIQISGGSVSLSRRLRWPDDYFSLSHSISFQHYELNDWSGFLFSNGGSNNFSISTKFSRNSVDNPLYSRNGSKFSLGLQFTPPYSLFNDENYKKLHKQNDDQKLYDWIEYHKWTFKYEWYTQVWGDLVFHSKAQLGYLGHYNNELGPSPFEGFNLGGDGMTGYNFYGRENIALRGYSNNSLTPPDGGNVYDKFTMELRYPISLKRSATIYGLAFLEGGNAWNKIENFNPYEINRSAGFGVRIFLPMLGLMGIDWGYGFDTIPTKNKDAWGSQFHFVMGRQF